MPKQKAFFIVFEGVEGSGKSYQSERLFNYLKKKNLKRLKQESQVEQKVLS